MSWKELLKNHSLEKKKTSHREVDNVLGKARRSLKAAEILLEKNFEEGAFKEAYDAMLLASRALIFSLGLRPRTVGSHTIAIRFCQQYLGADFKTLTNKFKRMKEKRNYLIYGASLAISETEARNAIRTGKKFVNLIEKEILKGRRQEKLI
jgi:uncharacterized protein (UPF0332 family)